VRGNRISGSRYGVRLFGPSTANHITGNRITHPAAFGVFVDHPSMQNSVSANQVLGGEIGIRVRGAPATLLVGNTIKEVTSHGIKVDGNMERVVTATRVSANQITGQGSSPIRIAVAKGDRVRAGRNASEWNYPFQHKLARLLSWFVGPGLWVALLLLALRGPRARRRGRVQAGEQT
jgi:hypothetical protein